jgi:hypothetical protein
MRWLVVGFFILCGFGAKPDSNSLNAVFGMKLLAETLLFCSRNRSFCKYISGKERLKTKPSSSERSLEIDGGETCDTPDVAMKMQHMPEGVESVVADVLELEVASAEEERVVRKEARKNGGVHVGKHETQLVLA